MMSKNITIRELRTQLHSDLSTLMSPGEAFSVSRIILEHTGFPEFTILKDPNTPVDFKIQATIQMIVGKLKKQEPIQYILGYTEFFDLKLEVNRHVLIPRQETEEMVSMILLELSGKEHAVLDLGTGSGCIAIALAKNLTHSGIDAMDLSEEALTVARKNSKNHSAEIHFIKADILTVMPETLPRKYDLIVSNPPYVTASERAHMLPNVTMFEPEEALYVPDNNPLMFYRAISNIAKDTLNPEGELWVEINESFGSQCVELFREAGFSGVKLLKDIHGKDRFVNATIDGRI